VTSGRQVRSRGDRSSWTATRSSAGTWSARSATLQTGQLRAPRPGLGNHLLGQHRQPRIVTTDDQLGPPSGSISLPGAMRDLVQPTTRAIGLTLRRVHEVRDGWTPARALLSRGARAPLGLSPPCARPAYQVQDQHPGCNSGCNRVGSSVSVGVRRRSVTPLEAPVTGFPYADGPSRTCHWRAGGVEVWSSPLSSAGSGSRTLPRRFVALDWSRRVCGRSGKWLGIGRAPCGRACSVRQLRPRRPPVERGVTCPLHGGSRAC
jgi:hypothetical protein